MTRFPASATRTILAVGTGATLVFGLSACAFEPVFSTTEESDEADRALAVSAPGTADLWRSSGIGPDALNEDAEDGDPLSFVDPVLFEEDGELPERMSVTEAQALQVLQKIADMVSEDGRRIAEIATVRAYLSAEEDGPDLEGWDRAYRKFFANIDPLTGESLLTGTSAVTLTVETSPEETTETTEPAEEDDDDDDTDDTDDGAASTPGTTDTTGDDEPYTGEPNSTKPSVVTVGVADQPVDGWLVQVEVEVIFENE